MFEVKPIEESEQKSLICNTILRSLPDWFGIESAILEYVYETRSMPFWAAFAGEKPIGFIALKIHNPYTAEIYVMGVLAEYHRHGIGQNLLRCTERFCLAKHYEYLTVKTLAESVQDMNYAQTRSFYFAMGFRPLEIFPLLWDEHNPCLFLVKQVTGGFSAGF